MPKAHQPITVGIVDDHEVTRRGVRQVLSRDKNIKVVGEAADALSGARLLRKHQPDVAIVDIKLGDSSGIDVIKAASLDSLATRPV